MAEHAKPMVITLGDAAGIGPEIIVKAFRDAPEQLQGCVVIGDLAVMQRAALLLAQCEYHEPQMHMQLVNDLREAAQIKVPFTIPVLQVTQPLAADQLPAWGQISATAGKLAADCVVWAAQAALRGEVSAVDERLFFAPVLGGGGGVDVLGAELGEGAVLLEGARQIEAEASVVALLVEVHGAHADGGRVEVRRDGDDEVIGAHVAEEADEAAFLELDQLLGEADRMVTVGVEPLLGEDVARDARDVFLDQGLAPGEVEHAVRGEQVFELQAADARGVADLHVEVVVVLVVRVDDADAEGLRVAERAEVDAVDVDVAEDLHAAFAAEQGVRLEQPLGEAAHDFGRVGDGFPQGILAAFEQGHRGGEVAQLRIRDRQRDFAAFAGKVGAELGADRIGRRQPCHQPVAAG